MSLLFVYLITAVVIGGICLWLSGFTLGLRLEKDALDNMEQSVESDDDDAHLKVEAEAEAARARLREAEIRSGVSEKAKAKADAEVARLSVELGSIEGELIRLKKDIVIVNDDNQTLRRELNAQNNFLKGNSVEADEALAELDMERVAHRETKEELTKKQAELVALKKIAMAADAQDAHGNASLSRSAGRRGAGFQTVSISTRSSMISGTEHDRLRQAHDQLQREKDKIEAELVRAQQELQLLKMRE